MTTENLKNSKDIGDLKGFQATIKPVNDCKLSKKSLEKIAKSLIGQPFHDKNKVQIGIITNAKVIDPSNGTVQITGAVK